MNGKQTNRIGPRMREAVEYIADHPGCSAVDVARHVGPHGSTQYGYRTVHRCIAAGLVRNRTPEGRWYSLCLTELGADAYEDGGAR